MIHRYSVFGGAKKLRTKTKFIVSASVLTITSLVGAVVLPLAAQAAANNNGPVACDKGRQVVNVYYTLVNDYDSGLHGNAWANDVVNRHLGVYSLGNNLYCATVNDTGSFITFAGDSPGGTGSVAQGVTGVINGGYVSTQFIGSLSASPAYKTSGYLGTFDLQCTDANNCPGARPSATSYFDSSLGYDLAQWGWMYHTAQNGNWVNAQTVNSGDITSL